MKSFTAAEIDALVKEWMSRPGRRMALATHPGATMVRALLERHDLRRVGRAVEIVHAVLWEAFPGEHVTKSAIERAYQKLKSGRSGFAFIDDGHKLMRAALARLREGR